MLIVVDAIAKHSNRQAEIASKHQSAKDKEEIQRLTTRFHESLLKIEELDRTFQSEQVYSQHLSRSLQKRKNFARHRVRMQVYAAQHDTESDSPPRYTAETRPPTEAPARAVSAPFTDFCEKLLYQNKIWKQQREIKNLQIALCEIKASNADNAFKAFCDRLLLSNKIWKQQKEINSLMAEAESLKKSRAAAVAHAAQQMADEVTKERLTEEYVKDLIAEVGECKQAICTLRVEHEEEMRELANLYRKDYLRMAKEIERLKLSLESRIVEQELSNRVEDELVERLAHLEEHDITLVGESGLESPNSYADYYTDDTLSESELENMSNMSTSTCVGSGGERSRKSSFEQGPEAKPAPQTPVRLVLREPPSSSTSTPLSKSPTPRMDESSYVGFSFNPLFFGGDAQSDSRKHVGPISKADFVAQQTKRAQWRM
ncbi:hypothetical protein JR316_0012352 [Psilocybe cubensis]|uniref:Uncharacterized protein n=1 Tax=Psilocybe cubensis TaxID=181762 RepID=A0ACB8GJ52_PSICU|nr:hypothetical protein JR316_0012352 [Psilocybe cubensis]KAH9475241.1 hypothetical protein JR316_0012352 [Psilocybe cubensis]